MSTGKQIQRDKRSPKRGEWISYVLRMEEEVSFKTSVLIFKCKHGLNHLNCMLFIPHLVISVCITKVNYTMDLCVLLCYIIILMLDVVLSEILDMVLSVCS
jgi:hypothetical protein